MKISDVHSKPLLEEPIELNEINMSPSSLRKLASGIAGAQAGMEFEMIVPGADGEDDEEYEPDFDQDERAYSFTDIEEFFTNGDNPNSRRDVRDLISRLQSKYEDYAMEKEAEDWMEVQEEETRRWIEENEWDEDEKLREALENMGLDEEAIEAAIMAGDRANSMSVDKEERARIKETEAYHHYNEASDSIIEMLDELVNDEVQNQGSSWQRAYDEWREGWEYPDETDFLDSEGYHSMRDIYQDGDLIWPYFMPSGNGGQAVEDVASEFGDAIGRPWNASSNYHGARRAPGKYVIEPDGSLEPDDPSSEAGLEFVSPPLPVAELLSDLQKVVAWAKSRGCYTNDSTGLHINVSVPSWEGNLEKLDYVKLAILLGDQYVLDQFGRAGNTYCKSALEMVKSRIAQRPEDAGALLKKMRDQLNTTASKLIHTGVTNKYTSINTKDGYVEFRSPGGDWLSEDIGKIENTLLRFVVALDAAADENKYREEYAKKLYKLLTPSNDSSDTLQYFVKFSSGQLPKSALTSFVRQAQLQRKLKKGQAPDGQKYWWNVQWDANRRMEVVAGSKKVALQVAAEEWGVPEEQLAGATVTPMYPYQEPGAVRASIGEPQPAGGFQEPNDNRGNLTPRGPGPWEIYRISDGTSVRELSHTNRAAAEQEARSALGLRAEAPELYGVRTRASAQPVAGSTQDLQQQRAQGAFTGSWKVMVDGEEVYRFGGVGNNQGDANRVAREWLTQQIRNRSLHVAASANIEVLPIMGD